MGGGPRAFAGALLLAAAAAAATAAAPRQLPHVTVIGDSVAYELQLDPAAVATLGRGADIELELEPCRRLGNVSCPNQDGVRPPTALQLIQTKGTALGPTVVMAVGYNDAEDEYAAEIEAALAALQDAGIKHVFWLTLRQVRHPYVTMDDDIYAAAAMHPGLVTVVDWNAYSRGHDEWFNDDGLHLVPVGAEAMARLIHSALVDAGIVAEPQTANPAPAHVKVATFKLPAATLGRPYAAKLTASGGRAPYRWTAVGLPKGLRLHRDGSVTGRPGGRVGDFRPTFRVTDAAGKAAKRRLALVVRG